MAADIVNELEKDQMETGSGDEVEQDDIVPEVAASDADMIAATESEANVEGRLSPLTSGNAPVARIALTKVRCRCRAL